MTISISSSSFNTASGKYCCNYDQFSEAVSVPLFVSIPQAVSTVATNKGFSFLTDQGPVSIPQAVSTVATCN